MLGHKANLRGKLVFFLFLHRLSISRYNLSVVGSIEMTMVYDIRSTGFNHFLLLAISTCLRSRFLSVRVILLQILPFYGFAFLSVRVILPKQNCTENGKKVE